MAGRRNKYLIERHSAQLRAVEEAVAVNGRERDHMGPAEAETCIAAPDDMCRREHTAGNVVPYFLFLFEDASKHHRFAQAEHSAA